MNDPSFEDLAREYGLDESDYSDPYVQNSGNAVVPVGQAYADDMYADPSNFDDSIEQYDNISSPSPPERIGASSSRTAYGYMQRSVPKITAQDLSDNDCITEYEDDFNGQGRNPFQYQLPHGPLSGSRVSGYNPGLPAPQFTLRQPQHAMPAVRPPPFAAATAQASRASVPTAYHQKQSERYVERSHLGQSSQRPHEELPEPQGLTRGGNPRNAHGIRLRPVSELPDIYRSLFKFGVFNAVQSKCFDTVMQTDENMVISAPTGSGKTVLFELAIIKMLTENGGNSRTSKCIYVAPTKALCSEKCRDWTTKFQPLGIDCCELTGDTVHFGKSAWGNAKDATVIVTTGEKWDSLTRNWGDHGHILSQIQLFLVDEVHILNESRGSTLEVILSRMKTRGSSVRFIVVSATVPNIEDVANWIGNDVAGGSATVMQFGDEFRPCKLSKFVYGIPKKRDQNDFVYQRTLDFRLYSIVQQHSVNKPMLVFVATRKGVMMTAEQLLKEYEEATQKKQTLPWSRPPRIEQTFQNKQLQKLTASGIGVHHAGLSMDDRRAIEDLYINKTLRIVVATSTLAVGVNLRQYQLPDISHPRRVFDIWLNDLTAAHTVIIKGVKMFQNNALQEYSDMDIVQMMGRAGRPQFDKEGVAIIMCETELEAKYKALVGGHTQLESSLHLNLSEHINSEIGLGTITSLETAKEWLHNSFLFQRIQKNPRHYALGKENGQTWQDRIDQMVTESVSKLQETQLVTDADKTDGHLCSTEFGDIMSKFYIRQSTMGLILKLPERVTFREIFEVISSAEEFSDVRLRGGEKQVYNKMRSHADIRFQMKKIEKPADKVFLLVQAVLGGLSLSDPEYRAGDSSPALESLTIFRHIARIARALVEVAIVKEAGAQLKHGLEAIRCLTARAWEDRPVVLRQIEQIGGKSLQILAEHGISSFDVLRKQDPMRLETLLNRRAPFGYEVLAFVKQLPEYTLKITEVDVTQGGGHHPVVVDLSIDCGLVTEDAIGPRFKKGKNKRSDMTIVLTLTSDFDYIDFRRIPTKNLRERKNFQVTAELQKPSQSIVVYIASESIAGVMVSATYKPKVDAKSFPIMDTRPQNAMDIMLEGLNDDPDFWNMDPDGDSDDKDVTERPNVSQHSFSPASPKQTVKSKTSAKPVGTSSAASFGPKQLSNGNFECNHACKDKMKCRHMCCRDGLAKPPPMSKRRVDAICASDESRPRETAQTRRTQDGVKPKPKPKQKPCDKPDARLDHLESLHKKNNVNEHLKISNNHRIKVDDQCASASDSKQKGRRKVAPKFDFDFVSLHDGAESSKLDVAELGDSDTELPEPREILYAYDSTVQRNRMNSDPSDTNYSNSEIDALIRDAPLPESTTFDDFDGNLVAHTPTRQTAESSHPTWTTLSPSPSGKRKPAEERTPPPVKRSKTSYKRPNIPRTPSPPSYSHRLASPFVKQSKGKAKETLFIDISSDEEELQAMRVDTPPKNSIESPARLGGSQDEEFVLDDSFFDIIPSTPALTAATTTSSIEHVSRVSDTHIPSSRRDVQTQQALRSGGSNLTKSGAQYNWGEVEKDPEHTAISYDKEFAELDEWLNSGLVEITEF